MNLKERIRSMYVVKGVLKKHYFDLLFYARPYIDKVLALIDDDLNFFKEQKNKKERNGQLSLF